MQRPDRVLFLIFDSVIKLLVIDPVVESLSLLTGYLGGAIATHVQVQSPLLTHPLPIYVAIYVAALLWGRLYLREARLRALVPLRTQRCRIALPRQAGQPHDTVPKLA